MSRRDSQAAKKGHDASVWINRIKRATAAFRGGPRQSQCTPLEYSLGGHVIQIETARWDVERPHLRYSRRDNDTGRDRMA